MNNLSLINNVKSRENALTIYARLRDICINENDEIEDEFLHFPVGTPRTDVWHWLEEEYDVSIAELEGLA